jgi:hypothetical protein
MTNWNNTKIDEKIRELREKQKAPETVSCFYLPKEKSGSALAASATGNKNKSDARPKRT